MKNSILFFSLFSLFIILNGAYISKGEYYINLSPNIITNNILKGDPIARENISICQEINYSQEGFNLPIKSGINITDSEFKGDVIFIECNFTGPINFTNTTFLGEVIFEDCKFQNNISFKKSTFCNVSSFSNSEFRGLITDFSETNFSNSIGFGETLFFGKLDLSNSNISNSYFYNSTFPIDGVNFNCSRFFGDFSAEFGQSKFLGETNFNKAIFYCDAEFENSIFYESPSFETTNFSLGAEFPGAKFLSGCNFKNAQFGNTADFSRIESMGPLRFTGSHFAEDADFFEDKTGSIVNFNDVIFDQKASFEGMQFNKTTEFDNSSFMGDVNLEGANFLEDLILTDSNFYGQVDFDKADINGDIRCQDIDFHQYSEDLPIFSYLFPPWVQRHPVLGNYSTIIKYKAKELTPNWLRRYQDRISMNGTEIEPGCLYINWGNISQGTLAFDEDTYLSLIKNYKNQGKIEDANACFYEYKRSSSYRLPLLYWLADSFYCIFCGYGARPDWTLFWGLLLIGLFSIYFWRNDSFGLESAVIFSTTTFISGTGKLLVDKPSYNPKKNLRISKSLFTLERVLGGILIFLFLISIGKIVTI